MMLFQKLARNLFLTLQRHNLTPKAVATLQVSHTLPAVRFSCLLRGRGASFQDGVVAGKRCLCVCNYFPTPSLACHVKGQP